jgi:hypothetical protein
MDRFGIAKIAQKKWFIRLTHKEFWAMWTHYLPAFFYYAFAALRERSLFFFTAANPTIPTGGMLGESKSDINKNIPPQYRPKNLMLFSTENKEKWFEKVEKEKFPFPAIVKPVVGGRGLMVEKVNNFDELAAHATRFGVDFIVEEFVDLPVEAAVLYWKNPVTNTSGILSVTLKEFLSVTGDGVSTVEQLLQQSFRGILQIERLQREKPDLMTQKPPFGASVLVEPVGNHCRGTMFLNGNDLINADMIAAFDGVHADLGDVFFFRLDLKAPNIADLQAARNLKILEINGVGSEPAHIYDPNFPLVSAWRDTLKLWRKIHEVSAANHRLGVAYQSRKEFMQFVKTQDAFVEAGKK